MSLQRLKDGGWRVRWRTPEGHHPSRTFRRGNGEKTAKQLAEDFQDRVNYERRFGHLDNLEPTRKTVAEVTAEWAASKTIRPKTQQLYEWLYRSQIAPTFGDTQIASIRPRDIEAWLADLDVGAPTKIKAAKLLSQIFKAAQRWEYCRSNPVAIVPKPKAPTKIAVRPPTPTAVEAIRARLSLSDSTLVAVLAYAGLRPQEALRLRWGDVRAKTLLIDAPKTGRSRSVRLLTPLAHDLARWAEECPDATGLVFPSPRGKMVTDSGWANWRRRVWQKAASEGMRPYDLRHTFVSLLIREGLSVVEVAGQAGHSPTECLKTYAHSWDEWTGAGSAVEAIEEAREEVVA